MTSSAPPRIRWGSPKPGSHSWSSSPTSPPTPRSKQISSRFPTSTSLTLTHPKPRTKDQHRFQLLDNAGHGPDDQRRSATPS